jgi:uncharacterized phage protein (TIGR02218 family)
MRTIPAALQAHLQGQVLTLATCIKLTRGDSVVMGFTSFDQDLVFQGLTYHAMDPISASSVNQSDGQAIDNMTVVGLLNSGRITDTDLLAGLYDGAAIELFQVNYRESPLVNRVVLITGTLGELTLSAGQYHTEIRALGQRLAQQIGEVTSPTCRVRALGDARCKIGIGAAAITAITNGPSGEVTTATPHGLITGQKVYFEGVTGMTVLNQTLRSVQLVVDATHFTLTDNTSGYGAYTGGGQVGFQFTRTVSTVESVTTFTLTTDLNVAGFYTYGRAQFLTGANAGIQREVNEYTRVASVPRIRLQQAFPFAIAPGDTLMLEAGCDRSKDTCQSRFGNVVSFRGEPWLPGSDVLIRHGRR